MYSVSASRIRQLIMVHFTSSEFTAISTFMDSSLSHFGLIILDVRDKFTTVQAHCHERFKCSINVFAWLVPTSSPSIFFYLPEIWLPLHHFTKPCENQWPLFVPFVTQHTGPYFPNQGSNLYSLQWKHGVLTPEPLRNSPMTTLLLSPKVFLSHFILLDFSVLQPIFSLKCPPPTTWFSWRLNRRAPVYPLL